jgi:hypothetical protein
MSGSRVTRLGVSGIWATFQPWPICFKFWPLLHRKRIKLDKLLVGLHFGRFLESRGRAFSQLHLITLPRNLCLDDLYVLSSYSSFILVSWVIRWTRSRTDVMIFKIFSPKNLAKILARFLTENKASFCKNCDHNIGLWEKRQFFCRKWVKIAENCDHNIDP